MNPMKDSGFEWAGKIPQSWNVKPIKYVLKAKKGLTITKADLVDTGIAVVSYGQIHSKANNGVHISEDLIRYISKENPNINHSALMGLGDIVFADTSEDYEGIGNAVLNDYREEIFAGYHTFIMTPKIKVNSKYLSYQFLTDAWRLQLRRLAFGVKVYSVTQKIINQSFVLLPSIKEQQAIADFLDEETKKLDDAKDLLQKQIEKLKEYRKSLIWETVTKGLDKSVPMKDSGVEWIGNIPSDWKLTRLKFITDGNLQYGANAEGVDYDENLPRYIRITDIDSNNNLKDSGKQSLSFNSAKPYILKKGDILFARSGATVGKTYLFQTDTLSAFAGYLIRYSPIENIESRFIYYMTLGSGYDNWKNSIFSQSTIQNIGADKYGNLPVVLPKDLEEQQAIADFLDEKTSIIENIISNIQSQIEVIDKQKKTLIYDYVTGKRRVI